MTPLQALVTGMIAGSLVKADEGPLAIDVELVYDEDGNYTNEIYVTGRNSRELLLITVTAKSEGVVHE